MSMTWAEIIDALIEEPIISGRARQRWAQRERHRRDREFGMKPTVRHMRELREVVMEAFEWTCQMCDAHASTRGIIHGPFTNSRLEIDRIVPGAKGGAYTFANITCLCRECNARKRDQTAPLKSLIDVVAEEFAQ